MLVNPVQTTLDEMSKAAGYDKRKDFTTAVCWQHGAMTVDFREALRILAQCHDDQRPPTAHELRALAGYYSNFPQD
jgi:hypothetical protein